MFKFLRSRCAHPMPSICLSVGLLFTLTMIGCGAEGPYREYEVSYDSDSTITEDSYPAGEATESVAGMIEDAAKPANEHLTKIMEQRKVVYTSDMHLEVKEFETAVVNLRTLVNEHQGFIATHNIDGGAGSRRSGHWKIRVPSVSFDSFHAGLKELGYPTKDRLDSKEVTEEYVDVVKRIENMKRMEQRLNELLKTNTKSLSDIFDVEKELSRVVGEIERMQGRLELLKDMTALATINLDISEEDVYEPPVLVAEVPPTFQERVNETFGASAGTFVELLQAATLLVIAITPWLPVLIAFVLFLRYVTKKSRPASVEF